MSPWAEFDEQRRASARKYKELRHRFGNAFHVVQIEAYETWCTWQEEIERNGQT
jgi:hypothetical protein